MIDFDVKKNVSAFAYYYAKLRRLNKLNDIFAVRKLSSNWYDAVLFRTGIKKKFVMRLREGKSIQINNYQDYSNFWESEDALNNRINYIKDLGYKIDLDKKAKLIKIIKFDKEILFYYDDLKQAGSTVGMIEENFVNEQYKNLDVKDKDVVDIGANIGDTAIYFALKGAKHVYAFEPYPYSYNLAKKNIELNKLENKITLLNEGCGKEGFVTIESKTKNYGGTDLKSFDTGIKIKISSLDLIAEKFKLNNAILKIDCEGCEYKTVLTANNKTLQKFNQIIIEYHYGYKNLKRKLEEAGFKVRYTLPNFSYNNYAKKREMYTGILFVKH